MAVLILGGVALAVVGGSDAEEGEWAWVAQIREGGRFSCTGSLVSSDLVLTAAHCLYAEDENTAAGDAAVPAQSLSVLLGEPERLDTAPGIGVQRILPHPLFDGTARHDVALLRLAEAAGEEPVDLAGEDGPLDLSARRASVAGWGATAAVGDREASEHLAGSLQAAEVVIGSDAYCRKRIKTWPWGIFGRLAGEPYVAGAELCTHDDGDVDACFGDSGGPLLFASPFATGLVGVVHGDPQVPSGPCSKGLPTLYARVDSEPLRSWVLRGIRGGAGSLVTLPERRCATDLPLPGVSPAQRRRTVVEFPAAIGGRGLVAFRDAVGSAVVGPRSWHCRAALGVDGTEFVTVAPTPVKEVAEDRAEAISLLVVPACAGCMAESLCAFFPEAPLVRTYARYSDCRRRSRRERVAFLGGYAATFEDPPGVEGQGQQSGGPNAAIGQLTYSRARGFSQLTCTMPARKAELCRAIASVGIATVSTATPAQTPG